MADVLQAVTPNTALKSEAMRLALPDICPGSVSSGLTHWRQFHGTVRVKGAGGKKTRKVALANAVPVVIEVMGPPVPPWMKSTALV